MEDAAPTERDKIMIRVLGDCGIRSGELCRLRHEDLIRRDGHTYLHIRGKGSRERLVPIMPALFRRIDRYARAGRPRDTDTGRLFVSIRRGLSGTHEALIPNGVGHEDAIADVAGHGGSASRDHASTAHHSPRTVYRCADGGSDVKVDRHARDLSANVVDMLERALFRSPGSHPPYEADNNHDYGNDNDPITDSQAQKGPELHKRESRHVYLL
jgi:integrase